LETKLDTIENILESLTLKANQLRDEVFDKPAELEEFRATSEEFQDMYYQVVSLIRRFIDKIKPKPPPSNLNLPVMPLPYFYGDYNEWIPYKDKFSRLIKDNEMIGDVQRLHYLKESLNGEAATLESTIDSFQSLWAAVCKRCEIRRIIGEKYIDKLIQIKPIRQESPGDLRHVLDFAVKNLRALETMKLKMNALSEQVMVNLITI
jgi:hypothetical protein